MSGTTIPGQNKLGCNGNEYSTLTKVPELVPHHQMQFNVIPGLTFWGGGIFSSAVSVFKAPPSRQPLLNCYCYYLSIFILVSLLLHLIRPVYLY